MTSRAHRLPERKPVDAHVTEDIRATIIVDCDGTDIIAIDFRLNLFQRICSKFALIPVNTAIKREKNNRFLLLAITRT
jgi:hypothetical protein